ncbi:MAG: hypothetical protein V3R85_03295, partial [Alphaproteobacteria bacterium]
MPIGRNIILTSLGGGDHEDGIRVSTQVDRWFMLPVLFGHAENGLLPWSSRLVGKTPWRLWHDMNQNPDKNVRRGQRRSFSGLLSVLICAGVLAGCSSVPDAVNPVEWYRDTRDWVTGADEPAKSSAAAKPSTANTKDFPSLNTVPTRPQAPTAAERKQLSSTLAADRQQARYSDEVIRRQTDTSGQLTQAGSAPAPTPPRAVQSARATPAPAPTLSATQPPPTPRPVVPVTPIAPPAAPSFDQSAPFPPMPDVPPVPLQTGIPVPSMPSAAPIPLPGPQAGVLAPRAQRPSPVRTPGMALLLPQSSPAVKGNLRFGPVPADIGLNSARPVARISQGGGGQRFVPAKRFS